MRIRNLIKRYFGFSRAETNGFVILIPIMVIVMISEPVYRNFFTSAPGEIQVQHLKIANNTSHDHPALVERKQSAVSIGNPFSFNPNTIQEDSLILLGFTQKLARRLINFREKGGRFYSSDDLLKLYGIDTALVETLKPWIDIPRANPFKKDYSAPVIAEKLDLNAADTVALKKLKGIGPAFARRIVRYRESLGGFIEPAQLNQVYGLDSLTVANLLKLVYIDENFAPRKLNLNDVEEKQLSSHPYMSKAEAKIIVMYRLQHGKFASLADLKKIHGIKEGTIDKILPYLIVE